MADNEKLIYRIREALAHLPEVKEKKMFRGVTFMVNGKMCLSAGNDEMMVRIDPELHEKALAKKGCRTMEMKGRQYKGYVYVSAAGMETKKDFDYWVELALDFNQRAKASPKSKEEKMSNTNALAQWSARGFSGSDSLHSCFQAHRR